jgi:threonylcarbamoyladenosine tRNA methylthiotransferase MtaB
MRRRYSISRFQEKLQQMREQLDRPAFTTDVIVGFPGETDQEFEETLEACRQAEFMKIHVFPFSPRKGTPAASYPDQVSPEVRKERVQRLSELERDLAENFYRQFEGEKLEVMVEREHPEKTGFVRGTDRRYIPVELPGNADEIGKIVSATGVQTHQHYLDAMRRSEANVTI